MQQPERDHDSQLPADWKPFFDTEGGKDGSMADSHQPGVFPNNIYRHFLAQFPVELRLGIFHYNQPILDYD